MDEEISIIDTKTRNEKIKDFLIKNRILIISNLLIIILLVLGFYSYQIYNDNQRKLLSEKFNGAVIEYKNDDKSKTFLLMKEIVQDKDSTYSPLALYFIIDNELTNNSEEINKLFDFLINKTSLEKEIRYLIIYKKALFNADLADENEMLDILKPIINSESVWKSHALYLMAEYFYSKNEKQKSKDFFNKIISIKNANKEIIKETQKRLNRDLSD